eukprot:6200568-Pleurochrysis_carterae.AAC.1
MHYAEAASTPNEQARQYPNLQRDLRGARLLAPAEVQAFARAPAELLAEAPARMLAEAPARLLALAQARELAPARARMIAHLVLEARPVDLLEVDKLDVARIISTASRCRCVWCR